MCSCNMNSMYINIGGIMLGFHNLFFILNVTFYLFVFVFDYTQEYSRTTPSTRLGTKPRPPIYKACI